MYVAPLGNNLGAWARVAYKRPETHEVHVPLRAFHPCNNLRLKPHLRQPCQANKDAVARSYLPRTHQGFNWARAAYGVSSPGPPLFELRSCMGMGIQSLGSPGRVWLGAVGSSQTQSRTDTKLGLGAWQAETHGRDGVLCGRGAVKALGSWNTCALA